MRLLLIGLAAGFFSALFGVGGGIVIVPLLLVAGRWEIRSATGTSLAAIEAPPMIPAGRQRTLPYSRWRQTPTITVGMMASSDDASACSCVSPSAVSVGTNRIPPPTPNRPERIPASTPSKTASTYVTAGASESR